MKNAYVPININIKVKVNNDMYKKGVWKTILCKQSCLLFIGILRPTAVFKVDASVFALTKSIANFMQFLKFVNCIYVKNDFKLNTYKKIG